MIGMNDAELNALIVVVMVYTEAYEDAVFLKTTPALDESDVWWVKSLEEAYDAPLEKILMMEASRTTRYFVALKVHREYVKAKNAYSDMVAANPPADNLPF